MNLLIHEEANAELRDIFYYYKAIPINLALNFRSEVFSKYHLIFNNPKSYPTVHNKIRKCNLDKFPYSILYYCNKDTIKIVAFAHFRRKPEYWKNRK